MNLTIFANEFVFPCFLFLLFAYILIVNPELNIPETNLVSTTRQVSIANQLESFFELVSNSGSLQTELDDISDRQELLNKLTLMASNHGYKFSKSDIDLAIRKYTPESQKDYIFLPIGCWRIS